MDPHRRCKLREIHRVFHLGKETRTQNTHARAGGHNPRMEHASAYGLSVLEFQPDPFPLSQAPRIPRCLSCLRGRKPVSQAGRPAARTSPKVGECFVPRTMRIRKRDCCVSVQCVDEMDAGAVGYVFFGSMRSHSGERAPFSPRASIRVTIGMYWAFSPSFRPRD